MGTVILTSLLLPGDTGSPLTLIVSITFTCAPALLFYFVPAKLIAPALKLTLKLAVVGATAPISWILE